MTWTKPSRNGRTMNEIAFQNVFSDFKMRYSIFSGLAESIYFLFPRISSFPRIKAHVCFQTCFSFASDPKSVRGWTRCRSTRYLPWGKEEENCIIYIVKAIKVSNITNLSFFKTMWTSCHLRVRQVHVKINNYCVNSHAIRHP